jgi:hypothetical protein
MTLRSKRLLKNKKMSASRSTTPTTDGSDGDESRLSQHDRIAECAYALYEQRGRQDGHDLDDWLDAERRIARSES